MKVLYHETLTGALSKVVNANAESPKPFVRVMGIQFFPDSSPTRV